MNKLNKFLLYALAGFSITLTSCETEEEAPIFQSDFEELTFPSGEDAYFGQDKAGEEMGTNDYGYTKYADTYTSGNVVYPITYLENEEGAYYWSGVAYSKQTNDTLKGTAGQFVAIPGEGANGSEIYAVMNGGDTISLMEGEVAPVSIQLTNNAYAYYTLLEGNQFSKEFGGVDGTDPDFFKVIITGVDEQGNTTGMVEFYLADFRFEDNSKDYIVDAWETVDLSSLGMVEKLAFSYESSDVGDWGINTPLYLALDNFKYKLPVLEE